MIVIPCAGASSRFKKAGIETPKHRLSMGGDTTLFDKVLDGLGDAIHTQPIVVVAKNTPEEKAFFEAVFRARNISEYEIVSPKDIGQGMLSDICAGLRKTRFDLAQPIYIHPSDLIHTEFEMPTAEERPCFVMDFEDRLKGTGCYYFSNAKDFIESYEASKMPGVRARMGERAMEAGEFGMFLWVLAKRGYYPKYRYINPKKIIHSGVPDHYMAALDRFLGETPDFPFTKNDPLLFSNDPKAVQHRNKIIKLWFTRIVEKHGLDDETESFCSSIIHYARQIETAVDGHVMGASLRSHIVNELSEAVQSQGDLAEQLEKMAYPILQVDSSEQDVEYMQSLEVQASKALFQFLTKPYSTQNAISFANGHSGFPRNVAEARAFYMFFWALPEERRTNALSHILGAGQGSAIAFKMKLSSVMERLVMDFLPPEKEGSKAREYGLSFTKAIFHSADEEKLVFLCSKLLSALHEDNTQPMSEDPGVRFGYRLTNFFIGIGGAKIAQGADSYHQTPYEWKQGTAQSKSRVAPMRRAAFIRKARADMPEDYRAGIKRIGRRLGTGTYIDTKEIEFTEEFLQRHPAMENQQGNGGLVLQLVKDNAGRLSEEIFSLAIRTLKDLTAGNPEAERSLSGFIPVIEHKARMIKEETDLRIVAQKARIAENLTSGRSIKMGKLTAHFSAAGVFASGERFKVSRQVLGPHFNDLPEGTRQERALKSAVAEAIFTQEILTILSGKQFNHDQHGDNNGITIKRSKSGGVEAHIGYFDDGAIILEPPTKRQQALFAHILMDALANSAINGFSPVSSLKHTFTKAQNNAVLQGRDTLDDLSYVDAMVEGVISLFDYKEHMGFPALLRSVRAVAASGLVSSEISGILGNRFNAVRRVQKGKPDAVEGARREEFYPPPTDENRRFTSAWNRTAGWLLMVGGRFLLTKPLPMKSSQLQFAHSIKPE